MMIESERANLCRYCGFDCGSPFFRLYWMADAMPLIVSSPGRGLKNESGDFETWGDGCKKEWWFQVRQKQCVLSKLRLSGSLELHHHQVHSTMNICDIHQRIQFSNFNIYKLLSFCNPFLLENILCSCSIAIYVEEWLGEQRGLENYKDPLETEEPIKKCASVEKYDHKKRGNRF